MSTIARDPIKPIMMIAALSYTMALAVALIWLHLSPIIILGMTLGGVVLAACTLRPILAIHGLIMLLQLQAVLASSDMGNIAAKGMGVVVVLSWLLNMAVYRNRQLKLDRFLLMMILFVLWCGLLIAMSIDAGVAAGRTMTFLQLVIGAAMFGTIIDSYEKLRGVYQTIVAWTTLSSLVGIAQYLSGMPEAVGLIGNRNVFAMYGTIAIVCAYLLHQSTRNPLEKLALAISTPILFVALALTFSRAGLLVLGVAMILVFAKAAKERRFFVLLISIVLITVIAAFLPAVFWSRASSIVPSIQRQEDTFGMRIRLWKAGMAMVVDHPIQGVGPGNYQVAVPRYMKGMMVEKRLGAHNSYVSVAAELGVAGLALFLILHIMALRRIHRASVNATRSGNKNLALLALTAEASILIVMLSGLSGHLEYTKYLWVFFGLAIAIGKLSDLESGSLAGSSPENADAVLAAGGAGANIRGINMDITINPEGAHGNPPR